MHGMHGFHMSQVSARKSWRRRGSRYLSPCNAAVLYINPCETLMFVNQFSGDMFWLYTALQPGKFT